MGVAVCDNTAVVAVIVGHDLLQTLWTEDGLRCRTLPMQSCLLSIQVDLVCFGRELTIDKYTNLNPILVVQGVSGHLVAIGSEETEVHHWRRRCFRWDNGIRSSLIGGSRFLLCRSNSSGRHVVVGVSFNIFLVFVVGLVWDSRIDLEMQQATRNVSY